jgi:hypothetical protein
MIFPVRHLLTGALCVVTTTSALAADETYEVKAKAAKATVGEKASASVTIASKKGWHLNAEAPLTLKLTPASGVTVDKPKLTRADLAASSENSARFDVSLAAANPGTSEIAAEAGFVLCQESECRPVKEKLVIGVDALPAKPVAEKPGKAKK